MPFTVTADRNSITERLDSMPDRVRERLLAVMKELDSELLTRVKSDAQAHVFTGQYLASIQGSVSANTAGIIARVLSGNPTAHLIEYGATRPAHDISARTAKTLAFMRGGTQAYAAHVHNPGSKMPAYAIMHGALYGMEEIITALTEAVLAAAEAV